MAALLVIECGVAALTSPILAIKEIQIRGVQPLPADEANAVITAATLAPGCNWFRVPRTRIAAQMRAMPWVKTVRLDRLFPDRLQVRVVPREPIAIAQAGTRQVEVDAEGVPIRPARRELNSRLPHVILPPGSALICGRLIQETGILAALTVLRRSAGEMPARIVKIEVDQNDNLCLNMNDNTPIQLGQPEDLDEKMAVVRRIYQRQPDIAKSLTAINVTCPAKPACKLRAALPLRPGAVPAQDIVHNR